MVSLERARECIGRPVKHLHTDVKGTVARVSQHDVWVLLEGGKFIEETIPCMPENLEWDTRAYQPIIDALLEGESYEDAQAGYLHDNKVGYIYSTRTANDDGDDHPLYVILYRVQRVHRSWPTADPWASYLFEEVLGWAQP